MVGRRIVILLGCCGAGLALASCSDDNGGDKAASATKTVTVTAPASVPAPKAKQGSSKGERKGRSSKGNLTTSPAVAEPPKTKVDKGAAKAGSGGQKTPAGDTAPPGTVQATNSSPPEVTLAVIDAESAYVKKSTVHRYAVLLDRLEASCTEERVLLAKFALAASNDTKGMNVRLSILDVLKEAAAAHPSSPCADVFNRVARRDTAP